MLGTNLSIKLAESDHSYQTDTDRLILMDEIEFDQLGVGLDDLIDGYIQTVLAVISIDKMCQKLITNDGNFDLQLFKHLNPDQILLDEILLQNL